jgi:hypothetical protein
MTANTKQENSAHSIYSTTYWFAEEKEGKKENYVFCSDTNLEIFNEIKFFPFCDRPKKKNTTIENLFIRKRSDEYSKLKFFSST